MRERLFKMYRAGVVGLWVVIAGMVVVCVARGSVGFVNRAEAAEGEAKESKAAGQDGQTASEGPVDPERARLLEELKAARERAAAARDQLEAVKKQTADGTARVGTAGTGVPAATIAAPTMAADVSVSPGERVMNEELTRLRNEVEATRAQRDEMRQRALQEEAERLLNEPRDIELMDRDRERRELLRLQQLRRAENPGADLPLSDALRTPTENDRAIYDRLIERTTPASPEHPVTRTQPPLLSERHYEAPPKPVTNNQLRLSERLRTNQTVIERGSRTRTNTVFRGGSRGK